MRHLLLLGLIFFLTGPSARAQDAPDQIEVDAAIAKGAKWLLKKYEKGVNTTSWNSTAEIVLLTLSHANVSPDDPTFKKILDDVVKDEPKYTYRAALRAMALQRIDPVKYQKELAHCAQWFVDTQNLKEGWGYPGKLESLTATAEPVLVKAPTIKESKGRKKGSSVSMIKIKRRPNVAQSYTGDISNSQFAVLGLWACAEAGIEIPKGTWNASIALFTRLQRKDGGWGYYFHKSKDKTSYASMTCAGICSIAVAVHNLGGKGANDKRVKVGLSWLAQNWSVSENAKVSDSNVVDPQVWHYYYLYSIERTGRILGTEKIGKRNWYAEGAPWILKKQKEDGSWHLGLTTQWKEAGDLESTDTCFAILFLAKATPPLVASGSSKKKDKEKKDKK